MRQTTQRSLILDHLRSTKTHPTAKEVYGGVKQSLPGVSLSTVYRTLSWLRENGDALEFSDAGGVSHYDAQTAEHGHFSCASCRKIWDIDLDMPELDREAVEAKTGWQVLGRRVELFGLCSKCRRQEEK